MHSSKGLFCGHWQGTSNTEVEKEKKHEESDQFENSQKWRMYQVALRLNVKL